MQGERGEQEEWRCKAQSKMTPLADQLNPARFPEVLVASCIYRNLNGAELVEPGEYLNTSLSGIAKTFLKRLLGDSDDSKDVLHTHLNPFFGGGD